MPRECAAAGCYEKATAESSLSFHLFPKDPYRRKEWAIKVKRKGPTGKLWMPKNHDVICSKHFVYEDFTPRTHLSGKDGFPQFAPELTDDAVPSVFDHNEGERKRQQEAAARRLSLANKRRRREVYKLFDRVTSGVKILADRMESSDTQMASEVKMEMDINGERLQNETKGLQAAQEDDTEVKMEKEGMGSHDNVKVELDVDGRMTQDVSKDADAHRNGWLHPVKLLDPADVKKEKVGEEQEEVEGPSVSQAFRPGGCSRQGHPDEHHLPYRVNLNESSAYPGGTVESAGDESFSIVFNIKQEVDSDSSETVHYDICAADQLVTMNQKSTEIKTDRTCTNKKAANGQTGNSFILKYPGEKLFPCRDCGTMFKRNSHLQHHMRTHTGEKPFVCRVCDAHFTQSCNLGKHMKKHSDVRTYRCKECSAVFKHSASLKKHIKTHTEQTENKMARTCKRAPAQEKFFACTECDENFTELASLKKREEKHAGTKPYSCSLCDATFTEGSSLKSHMNDHFGPQPYMCLECGKSFTQASNLRVHVRIHTGEKPYMCSECGTAYRSSSYLKRHMRKHTGEKPYSCTECEQTFTRSGHLKIHMLKHSGVKPYVCSECSAAFSQSVNLQSHMRTHTGEKPFNCTECGASFGKSSTLKLHLQSHLGDQPYVCSVCDAAFSSSTHLRLHMRRHTGRNSFECAKCKKSFGRLYTLRVHMLTKAHLSK